MKINTAMITAIAVLLLATGCAITPKENAITISGTMSQSGESVTGQINSLREEMSGTEQSGTQETRIEQTETVVTPATNTAIDPTTTGGKLPADVSGVLNEMKDQPKSTGFTEKDVDFLERIIKSIEGLSDKK